MMLYLEIKVVEKDTTILNVSWSNCVCKPITYKQITIKIIFSFLHMSHMNLLILSNLS